MIDAGFPLFLFIILQLPQLVNFHFVFYLVSERKSRLGVIQQKFEYRNPKLETNPNIECSNDKNKQIEKSMFLSLKHFGFWSLFRISRFGFRIS